MDGKTKWLLLFGPTLVNFVYAATSPTVHIYFISLISPQILAVSNLINVGLGAIINSTIISFRDVYRRYFLHIIFIDVTLFWCISVTGIEYPAVRFIGLAILYAISTTLWVMIMKDAVNGILNGVKLTKWQALLESYDLYGAFLGGIIAVFVTNLDVEICIIFQCIANALMGITDYVAYRRIEKGLDKKRRFDILFLGRLLVFLHNTAFYTNSPLNPHTAKVKRFGISALPFVI